MCGHFCVFHVFRGQWLSVHAAIANHAHRDALDGEGLLPRVDLDRLEVGVLGQQLDALDAIEGNTPTPSNAPAASPAAPANATSFAAGALNRNVTVPSSRTSGELIVALNGIRFSVFFWGL